MRLKEQSKGVSIANLRAWALVCVTLGAAAVTILLRGLLKVDMISPDMEQVMGLFSEDQTRTYVIVTLICLAVETCAVPLFAVMLVEGSYRTLDFSKYMIRTALVAVVSEIPYDYATQGRVLDLTNLNPAFGTAIALVMLYFFLRYSDRTVGHYILRSVITIAMILWTMIFNVTQGPCIVLITAVLWTFWNKPLWRSIIGALACLVCAVLISPFYIAAPLAMILIYFYRGEKGMDFKWGRLVAYPAILILVAVVLLFLR